MSICTMHKPRTITSLGGDLVSKTPATKALHRHTEKTDHAQLKDWDLEQFRELRWESIPGAIHFPKRDFYIPSCEPKLGGHSRRCSLKAKYDFFHLTVWIDFFLFASFHRCNLMKQNIAIFLLSILLSRSNNRYNAHGRCVWELLITVTLEMSECNRVSYILLYLIRSKHWSISWLGVMRHQVIISTNAVWDSDAISVISRRVRQRAKWSPVGPIINKLCQEIQRNV